MPKGAVDAKETGTPIADTSPQDSAPRDIRPLSDDLGGGTDLSQQFDTPDVDGGLEDCIPLPVTWLPEPDVLACPPSSSPSACAGGDVGAVVARNGACIRAWGEVPFQCLIWPAPAATEEIVVLEVADCTDSVEITTALACCNRIEISCADTGTCQTCDGRRSKLRAFVLPLDARPVAATGRVIVCNLNPAHGPPEEAAQRPPIGRTACRLGSHGGSLLWAYRTGGSMV